MKKFFGRFFILVECRRRFCSFENKGIYFFRYNFVKFLNLDDDKFNVVKRSFLIILFWKCFIGLFVIINLVRFVGFKCLNRFGRVKCKLLEVIFRVCKVDDMFLNVFCKI